MLPAIVFSSLSAISFGFAIAFGWKLADVRSAPLRRIGESRAALAAAIGAVILMLAALFWAMYLVFGPVHDFVVEVAGAGGD